MDCCSGKNSNDDEVEENRILHRFHLSDVQSRRRRSLDLLFTCTFAQNIWGKLRNSFNVNTWDTSSVSEAYKTWSATGLTDAGKLIWKVLIHAGSGIFGKRNRRIFEDRDATVEHIIETIKFTVGDGLQIIKR